MEHAIHAWCPRIKNPKPKKGEKHVRPALPGVVFIPEGEIELADKLQSLRKVPAFTMMLMNGVEAKTSHRELSIFDMAVNGQSDGGICGRIEVGDEIDVTAGPLTGLEGVVTGFFIDFVTYVKVKTPSIATEINLPASLVRVKA